MCIENLFYLQMPYLQSRLTRELGSTAISVQESKESPAIMDALINKVSDQEGAILSLNQKIADMAQEIEDHDKAYAAKDGEIKRLLVNNFKNSIKFARKYFTRN